MNTALAMPPVISTELIHSASLPWDSGRQSQRRFRLLTLQVLGGSLLLLILINQLIPYPEKNRQLAEKLPARMARVILEEKQQAQILQPVELATVAAEAEAVAEPVAEPEPVIAEASPDVTAGPAPAAEPAPRVVESGSASARASEAEIAQARASAANKGVLALSSQLSALTTLAPKANTSGTLKTASQTASSGRAGGSIDAAATAGSGGISTTQVAAPKAQALTQRDTSVAVSDDSRLQASAGQRSDVRHAEELQLIFDQNKAAFFSLYKRALRQTLGLQGRVVFELVVLADGSVADCRIKSSELDAPELEQRLVARIMTMNFGAKNVERWTFDYHIDFAPAG